MKHSMIFSSFYSRMGLLLIVFAVAGFLPFVYARFSSGGTMGLVMAVHAIVFLGWFFLFISQAALISHRNIKLHMAMGKSSLMLAGAMVITALLLTQQSWALQSTGGTPFPPAQFIMLPLLDISLFLIFYVAGFLRRREALVHKHLMLFAGIVMMEPALARFGMTLGFAPLGMLLHFGLVMLVVLHDRKVRGAVHGVTKLGAVALVFRYGIFFGFGPTETWAAIVPMLLGTP